MHSLFEIQHLSYAYHTMQGKPLPYQISPLPLIQETLLPSSDPADVENPPS